MILVDTRWYGANGIGRYAHEVIQRFNFGWKPIESKKSPTAPLSLLNTYTQIRIEKPDLIYSPGYAGYLGNKNQIITVHDLIHLEINTPKRTLYKIYYNSVLKPIIKKGGKVITVSKTSAAKLEYWLNDSSVDVINAGNGCSSAFNESVTPYAPSFKYILYVGNMKKHKNFETLIKTMKLVRNKKLIVVSKSINEIMELASEHGVIDKILCIGAINDSSLASLYRGAEITAVPSKLEGYGLPALESICCGTPVAFWKGCESVSEIVGGLGPSAQSLTNIDEWAEILNRKYERVTISHRPSWDEVGLKVENAIQDSIRN